MRQLIVLYTLLLTLACTSGCSSLGLSFWPSQFPLLHATKKLAAQAPTPAGLPSELAKQVIHAYYLEPGDRILIEAVKFDSDFRTIGDQKVQLDGSIDLGKFGRLRVAGMTVEAIEVAIEDRMREATGVMEAINVQLLEPNAAEVYVLGAVGSPGAYAIDGHETVLDAILTAGGLTSDASPCDIILVRPTAHCDNRIVLPICYRQITQIGDTSSNYQLYPGDRIVVGARTLCEELALWRQSVPCPACKCKPKVECNPASKSYTNRFADWATAFPLPRVFQQSKDIEPSEEVVEADVAPGGSRIEESPSDQNPDADQDIFLPSIPKTQSDEAKAPVVESSSRLKSHFNSLK
jgi:polysaccharide export outer membrane protein